MHFCSDFFGDFSSSTVNMLHRVFYLYRTGDTISGQHFFKEVQTDLTHSNKSAVLQKMVLQDFTKKGRYKHRTCYVTEYISSLWCKSNTRFLECIYPPGNVPAGKRKVCPKYIFQPLALGCPPPAKLKVNRL